jgi:hypothetical protein
MATASGSGTWVGRGVYRVVWTLTGTVSNGRYESTPRLPDKTVAVRGTFGGGTITIEGSNLAVGATGLAATGNWFALNDTRGEGNALTFTTADGRVILENPNCIRPRFTTLVSTVTPSVTVTMVCQSTRR